MKKVLSLKKKGREDTKKKKIREKVKKDNSQTELTKFFGRSGATTNQDSSKTITPEKVITLNKKTVPTYTSPFIKVLSPWKQATPSNISIKTDKSSSCKQTTPKIKQVSLKRPRPSKTTPIDTPTKDSCTKQRRIEDYKNFTPTKLAYVLAQSNNNEVESTGVNKSVVDSSLHTVNGSHISIVHDRGIADVCVNDSGSKAKKALFVNNKATYSNDKNSTELTTHTRTNSTEHKNVIVGNDDKNEEHKEERLAIKDTITADIKEGHFELSTMKENINGTCTSDAKRHKHQVYVVEEKGSEEKEHKRIEKENRYSLMEEEPKEEIKDHKQLEKGTSLKEDKREMPSTEEQDISYFSDNDSDLDALLCNFSIRSHDDHMTLPLRYKVQSIEYGTYNDENSISKRTCSKVQLVIELISIDEGNNNSKTICFLRDDWVQTDIRVNDIVHIVSDYSSSSTSSDYSHMIQLKEEGGEEENYYITISNDSVSCIIINPDYLISGTTIANGITCTRRAVLEELFKGHSEQNEVMLMGKALHDIFQQSITAASKGVEITPEYVGSLIPHLVYHVSTIQQLYVLDMMESQFEEQLMEYVPLIVQWCNDYQINSQDNWRRMEWKRTQYSGTEMMKASVSSVLDIEENVWCPRFGLKGKVDATVELKVSNGRDYCEQFITPLELKTGKKANVIQHRAQVLLYCLMLCDRHMTPVPAGLLYYMKVDDTSSVPAKDNELRALLIARNHLARYHGNHWDHMTLPEMIKEPRTCRYCPVLSHCALYHKSFENGTVASSGIGEHYPIKLNQMTSSWVEFYKHWHQLVLEETTYEQVQSLHDLIWRTDIEKRVNEGVCISDLLSCQHEPLLNSLMRTKQMFIRQDKSNFHIFNCYDRVVVSQVMGGSCRRSLAVAMGYIITINNQSLTLALDKFVPVGSIYCIDVTPARVGGVVLSTLATVCTSDGEREQQLRELVIDLKEPRYSLPPATNSVTSNELLLIESLNTDQRTAIKKVLLAKDYSLILGMPGTGKTTTISCLIELLLARGHSVLLTSFTNSAVDNVLIKLLEKGVNFIRLGSIGKIHSLVNKYSVHELTKDINSLEELKTLYQEKLLVATTCHSVDHSIFKGRTFDYCIMDEAGQIPLPLSLAPLRSASCFVLVGDHYQLPPLVRSPLARKGGYEESLFKRLSTAHPFTLTSLTLQHRMNRDIMHLSNELIYNNLLQCASEEVAIATLDIPRQLDTGLYDEWLTKTLDSKTSVVFLNTDKCGTELENKSGDQISNLFEANHIIEIIKSLIELGVSPNDVLVITQYKHQQRLIARLLFEEEQSERTHSNTGRQHGYQSVEVLTVDKCQGRDKKCVLLSFVRSNNNGKVGNLLLNWQRINVALTRAKHKLIFIGSCHTLSNAPYILKLIKLVQKYYCLIDL